MDGMRLFDVSHGGWHEHKANTTRLIDFGFHAPTMSFAVAGTLMIAPTGSESLAEIDRFCDAMLAFAAEIRCIHDGVWPEDDNPLVNAPTPRRPS